MLKEIVLAATLIASTCAPEASEDRITEALTPADTYFVIEGADLDKFIKNANQLYNIGWQREQIAKIYVIEAEEKHSNWRFQIEHVFFVTPDHCIGYYQQVYKAIIELLLLDDPSTVLGGPNPEGE